MDISVIITAHGEGRLAHHTMMSVLDAMQRASSAGLLCECVVVLDNPTEATIGYFRRYEGDERIRMERTEFSDPGPARNRGAELARGKWCALLDADDIFGSDWLGLAHAKAGSISSPVVLHPEYFVFFQGEHYVARSMSTSDEGFDSSRLMQSNCWSSIHFMTQRQTLLDLPFHPTPRGSGLGYEDWHWYCEALARGIPIERVHGAVVFYRKRDSSRLVYHHGERVLIPPTRLFEYPADASAYKRIFGEDFVRGDKQ